ncbi:MAG: carbon-nitrogen hydrolase family protein [Burkholderiaceae bacterium]
MRIAALQMISGADVQANLDRAAALIQEAASQGATVVALPEYFCFMGANDRDKLAIAEAAVPIGARPGVQSPLQHKLSELSERLGVWILGGTVPIAGSDADHVYNASIVFSATGHVAARYDKMHLFCFDNGRERYDEGQVLQAGQTPVACDMSIQGIDWRLGLSVCYDLRFPELYRHVMKPPCDILAVPAAFTYTTGQAHWELLLRARAVENQCYVIAPAQGGRHDNGRRTWGHSMVIDPWGEVLAVLPEGEGVVMAEVNSERLAQVREQLPALTHRRAL